MRKRNKRTTSIPIYFGNDLRVWATWLYYAESLTQAEIAVTLGVSRASVVNYLNEGRRANLVSVNLTNGLLQQVAISKKLSKRYQLQSAYVTPSITEQNNKAKPLRQQLGIAGAHALVSFIKDGTMLGISSGRTMVEVGNALPTIKSNDLRIVQVSGSSLGDKLISPETGIMMIANRLNARCYNLHAPAALTSNTLRNALLEEPFLKRHFEHIKNCNMVIYSVGEVTPETSMDEEEVLVQPLFNTYIQRGAIALLIGRFIDANGQELDGPLKERQIGIELHDLCNIPIRLCVAGGVEKINAIRAVLAGRHATHLVTDEKTALTLLEER